MIFWFSCSQFLAIGTVMCVLWFILLWGDGGSIAGLFTKSQGFYKHFESDFPLPSVLSYCLCFWKLKLVSRSLESPYLLNICESAWKPDTAFYISFRPLCEKLHRDIFHYLLRVLMLWLFLTSSKHVLKTNGNFLLDTPCTHAYVNNHLLVRMLDSLNSANLCMLP